MQEIGNTAVQAEAFAVEKRKSQRFAIKRDASFIIQRDWSYLAQIVLDTNNIIIGEIKDISQGGVACEVGYQFDIIDPVRVEVIFSVKNNKSGINSFAQIRVPAKIVRAKALEGIFCEIGIQFTTSDAVTEKLERFISEVI